MLPLLLLALSAAPAARARESSPQDAAAIKQVMTDFQNAPHRHRDATLRAEEKSRRAAPVVPFAPWLLRERPR